MPGSIAVERRRRLWHGAAMAQRTSKSGGFLLMAAILLGSVTGIMLGNPMKGILIGTGLGIAAAILVWLLDRRRG
jgi:hypothetical protein